jgi:hypothetical protein
MLKNKDINSSVNAARYKTSRTEWEIITLKWNVQKCLNFIETFRVKSVCWNSGYNYYVHGSVHHESMSIIVQQDATIYSLLYFCKLLYMFRVGTSLIIRSTYNCNYSIWHWLNPLCYLPLSWRSWNSKYVEQSTEIQGINKRMVRFQKLTRNLFLTLHGHNVHRQQRQLSKFLMR